MRTAFTSFLKSRPDAQGITSEQREKLFAQFMQWWTQQKTSQR
jgi:hypothetical protein